jgi:hypothetical protein
VRDRRRAGDRPRAPGRAAVGLAGLAGLTGLAGLAGLDRLDRLGG